MERYKFFSGTNPIIERINKLRHENERLGREADELFDDYCDEGNEDSFWDNAPTHEITRNSQIWDQIRKNDDEIAKLYKKLSQMKK